MTSMQAAALWVGLNSLFLIYISARVGQVRIKTKTNLGDGGNDEMLKAIRTQGNYVEYAPAALLGLVVLGNLNLGSFWIHALGGGFFLARVAHFLGLGLGVWPQGRFIGTAGTVVALIVTAALLFVKAFS